MTDEKDVRTKILARAEANRQEHLAAGVYTLEEEARVAGMPLKLPEPGATAMRRIDQLQMAINQSYDPLGLPEITSHRPVIGRFIVAFKRLVCRLTRFHTDTILARQASFNLQSVQLLNELIQAQREMLSSQGQARSDIQDLSKRMDEFSQRLVRLTRRVQAAPAAAGPVQQAPAAAPAPAQAEVLPALEYAAFEDRHRGGEAEIKSRQTGYVDLFRAAPGPVLDLGCGRGEFLELLAGAGLEAYGVDTNAEMVRQVKEKGLRVEQTDGLSHLETLDKASLGGLFMAQVIEHLTLSQMAALLEAAFQALKPGGVILAETVNPQTLATFAGAFYVDPTHIRPIHPEGATFLWESAGFKEVRILKVNPFPEEGRLKKIDPTLPGAEEVNKNFEKLNDLIYGSLDYAVIGVR